MPMESLYRFRPVLKSVVWGGEKIMRLKGVSFPEGNIGESWEISGVRDRETQVCGGPDDGLTLSRLIGKYGTRLLGERSVAHFGMEMPLLVKIIDARRDLSLQVHPDQKMATRLHGCNGKSEMWYVLSSDPGALIYSGFRRQLTPHQFLSHVQDGTVMENIASGHPAPGDVYYLPAGRIHSIGGGNLLVEIQQSSDITYRVFDFGRGRELHLDLAIQALNFDDIQADYRQEYDREKSITTVIESPHFRVSRLSVSGSAQLPECPESFRILICVEGRCQVSAGDQTLPLNFGHSLLVSAESPQIQFSGNARILIAQIP